MVGIQGHYIPGMDTVRGESEVRPTKREHYLEVAATVAMRSPCKRRRYGAIIVKDDRIIGWGYNGPARGVPHCEECARMNAPHNSAYTDDCPAVHAETNALIQGNGAEYKGATMYLAGWSDNGDGTLERIENPSPCVVCWRNIMNAQIDEVIG